MLKNSQDINYKSVDVLFILVVLIFYYFSISPCYSSCSDNCYNC